jgi:hypothetical protein
MASGSVVQSVSTLTAGVGTSGPYASTTSTSFVSTGVAGSITPSSASNKVLVTITVGNIYTTSNGYEAFLTIYRGGTNISPAGTGVTQAMAASFANGAAGIEVPYSIQFLDNPATTSSTTYTLYWAVNTGTAYLGRNAPMATVTLQEIAA